MPNIRLFYVLKKTDKRKLFLPAYTLAEGYR